MDQYFDIIIVGGGPAGLTAAVYARRAGKSVLLLERESFGGQIASSPKVENFPGLPAVSGAELAERLYSQAEALETRIELEEALEIQSGTPSRVVTDYGAYTAGAVILAAGMRRRSPGPCGRGSSGRHLLLRCVRRSLLRRTWMWQWPEAAAPPCRMRCIWQTSAAM